MRVHLILIIVFGLFISCNDNVEGVETIGNSNNIYMPLTNGNYWKYKVTNATSTYRDSLFILKDTIIMGKTYKKMKTKNVPFGFYCNGLNGNSIRKDGDKLLVTGGANFNFIPNFPIDVSLSDFVSFKENGDNLEVGIKSGIVEQSFNNFPLKIEYALKSISLPKLPTFTTPSNVTYTDVKPMKLVLNLKISNTTVFLGNPISIGILNSQDVVVSTQYYAKNKGMVYNKTIISYQLQPLPAGINIGIPQSGSQTQEETLEGFLAN